MDNTTRKRSSLKPEHLPSEGMSLEQYVETNKNKTITWDRKVIIEEENVTDVEMVDKTKECEFKEPYKVEHVTENLEEMNIYTRYEKRRSSK
jgi:hypothetical protein